MQEQTYDINIEATVISSIIYNPALLDKYASKITEKLFFLPLHAKIIHIILDFYNTEKVIDEELIRNKLGREYEDDFIYILTKNPVNHLEDYLKILQDYSIKREMQAVAFDITKSLQSNITGLELQAKVSNLTQEIASANTLDIFEINNIESIEDKEVDFICRSWLPIPVRTVSLVTAPGGTGKSWFVQQLAIRAINEGIIKKAFLWLSEDPKEISKNRFTKVFEKVLKLKDNSIKSKIDISDSPTIQFLYDDQRKVEVSPLFSHFKAKLQSYDLIILDPLIAFYGTDENNNSSARRFMQLFTDWANKENKTIIFIHHSTKNTTQSRGASAFVDAVRTVYEIDKIRDKEGNEQDTHKRIIKLTKDNYGISNILESFSVQRELFPIKIQHKEVSYKDDSLAFGIPTDF
ncbi:AAA family ATPase [Sulfurimonas paralvinellae]|uniref:AAA family ATPase n=1 Tax=Sulfurimonas paralvinellae TaxID=317658 RepID=A0A7M1BAN1_9BACT|nr:AAA family ATPase [Sulfurimonas paralvinellae]QOP46764.1 AAA family ATPase [Sulfurimonas paralvinellae]